MLFLAVGMMVVGLLVVCIAGLQVVFYLLDVARGETGQPKRAPIDKALYWLSGLGVVLLVGGIILWRGGAAG